MTDQTEQQETSPMGDVVRGPWGRRDEQSDRTADAGHEDLVAEPAAADEVVEREPVDAPTRRLPNTEGDIERSGPFGTVVSSRPLTVEQAGSRYRYIADVTRAGTRTLPVKLLDGVANRAKLAHYREGGHHRGEVLPQNRNAYAAELEARRQRRREIGLAVFTKKSRKSSGGGRFRAAQVRETRSPRWLTVAPAGAEVAAVAYPSSAVTAPVHAVNGQIGGFLAALGGNAAEAIGAALLSPGGALTAAAAAIGVAGWQAVGEHRDRQDARQALMSQDGNGDLADGTEADMITAALRAAGALKTPTANSPGQRVDLEAPVVSDGASWTARVVLPGGVTTAAVRKRLESLASSLDRNLPQVAVINGKSERRFTLRVWMGDALPFTGEPVTSPLVSAAAHRLDRGVPVGRDVDGNEVLLHLAKGRHGLVVASSGNGKTVLLQGIGAATALDVTAKLTILDGKPDGAYTAFQPVCWEYATTAGDGFEERGAAVLEAVADDMDAQLAKAENGQEIDGEHIVIIDEFQEWTGSSNGAGQAVGEPRYRMRAALERIARRGRAAGVRLVLASQQYDGRTLDDGVLTNIGWRSVGYAPKKMSLEALGPLAERYALDTSTMFVDEVQAGASLVAGGGVHPYKSQRSYLLTDDDLAGIVGRARTLREQQRAAGPTRMAPAGPEQTTRADLSELDADEAAVVRAAAEVYAADDAETVTAAELSAEVVAGELGWDPEDQASKTVVADALRKAGVAKVRNTEQVGGKRTTVTRYNRADLVAAGHSASAAA